MTKALLILLFIITPFFFKNDVSKPQHGNDNNTYDIEVYLEWKNSGSGYWTQNDDYYVYNDFDFMVTRSTTTFNGYYYFDIWFFSQSYYWDGVEATYTATNVKDVIVTVDIGNGPREVVRDVSDIGVTFDDITLVKSIRFISTVKQPYIWITWNSMSAK